MGINNRLNTEITKLREETNASVEKLALMNKEARAEMKKEMLYAIRSAADVAKADLEIAIKDGEEKMVKFMVKAAASHINSHMERTALKSEVAANAAEVTRMINDAVDTDARAQASLGQETAAAIKKTNTQVDAYAAQMRVIAKKTRDDIDALTKKTLGVIDTENQRVKTNVKNFKAEDAARQKSALKFLEDQLKIASEKSKKKFGDAYQKLSDDRASADRDLARETQGLNDSLAKQAALADSRFEKTVKDLAAARKQAAEQVAQFRKQFGVAIVVTTAKVKQVEQKLVDEIAKVSGEVISLKANQARVNRKVDEELSRVEELSNNRFTQSKDARGKLRQIMDDNKAAAAAEVKALKKHLQGELLKRRAHNAHNKREMAKDLTHATTAFYEKLSAQQKAQMAATNALNAATGAAKEASAAALKRAQENFDSKIVMLTNTVTANAATAKKGIDKLTGVVGDYAKASAADRELIKQETAAMEADLNKALERAISIGEAKAKAVEQRIAEHLKNTKRFLQVELNTQVEEAADNVLKIIEGKRQKVADNYLSLKAYAVASADSIEDYVTKGKGRGLSSVGDLLVTVGSLGAVHAKPKEGLGMGGSELPAIFSGDTIKVSNAVAAINGLVNEYTESCGQVRARWPMGLGKYLMDKLEGKSGNFVYMNGRSVGLSNKLSDFATLAARMTTYESVLAKMTSKITAPHKPAEVYAKPPEYEGD